MSLKLDAACKNASPINPPTFWFPDIGKSFPVLFYRDRKLSERLALSIGMFTRGEVGAGIIFIALGYNLGGPALVISVLTLVLNLILTSIFVLWVKNLALRSYNG